MKRTSEEGLTCIECHHGIAHELPDDVDFEEEMEKMGLSRINQSIHTANISKSKEEHQYDQHS